MTFSFNHYLIYIVEGGNLNISNFTCLTGDQKPEDETVCLLCENEYECCWIFNRKIQRPEYSPIESEDLSTYIRYYFNPDIFFNLNDRGYKIRV